MNGGIKITTVILGSKPDPIIPKKFDTIVFVNGSISHISSLCQAQEIYHIVSYAVLDLNNHVTSQLRSQRVDKLIISGGKETDEIKYKKRLKALHYHYGEFEIISKKYRELIIFSTTQKYRYIFMSLAVSVTLNEKINNLFHLLFATGEESGFFRPSTGVFSLVYSLYNGIGSPPYYLCGVGIDEDGHCHSQEYKYHSKHFQMDIAVLRILSQMQNYKTKIIITDKKLERHVRNKC